MTILFDLDGTLIDSTEAILESFYTALEKNNCKKIDQESIKKLIGYPLDVMFREVGVDEALVSKCVKDYKAHYKVVSKEKTYLLPYARESIALASKIARLGVVTTKTGRYSKDLLEHFGVMEFFEVLIGREDVTKPKPDPEPIYKALAAMGIKEKKDVWMIGDTKLDLECAKAAGVEAIGVLSGYGTKKQLQKYGYSVVANAFEAVTMLSQ